MKFSILIPAYKDKYLNECITSCLAQTYNDYEIIIVNDNSPYNLDLIVSNYKKNAHIRYYKNKTGFGAENLVGNWNRCLEYALGEYVMCIGDDDKLKPNCLEDYNLLIEKHPNLDVYHMRMEIINENSLVTTIQECRPETETAYSMIWHFWHGRRQVIGDWLFKTRVLKACGGFVNFPYGWSSDNATAFMMAAQKGVANTKYPGFQYRESMVAITSNNTPKTAIGKIKAWKEVKRWYILFLQGTRTIDEVDIIYKKDIIKLLDRYFARKIEGEFESGITAYPLSFTKWMKTAKETDISIFYILKLYTKKILRFTNF